MKEAQSAVQQHNDRSFGSVQQVLTSEWTLTRRPLRAASSVSPKESLKPLQRWGVRCLSSKCLIVQLVPCQCEGRSSTRLVSCHC